MIKIETYYILLNRASDKFLCCNPPHEPMMSAYMETTAYDRAMKFGTTRDQAEKSLVKVLDCLSKAIGDMEEKNSTDLYYRNLLERFRKIDLVLIQATVETNVSLRKLNR